MGFIAGRRHGRHDRVRQHGPMSHGEIVVKLRGHRLGGLGDLSQRVRDKLLRGRLPVPAGQDLQADQPRDRAEPGQVVRPFVGHTGAVVRARHAGTSHVALHGPCQSRAPQKLSRHESDHVRVQVIVDGHTHNNISLHLYCIIGEVTLIKKKKNDSFLFFHKSNIY